MKLMAKQKNKRGFTLMETLVAISIILVGISAAFTVAQIGVSSSSAAKSRITAFFLAQEAFEALKNRRDLNLLKNNANPNSAYWLEGLTRVPGGGPGPCPDALTACDYDIVNNVFNLCTNLNNCILQNITSLDSIQYYGYLPGNPNSKYKREIFIDEIAPGIEAKVTVRVSWNSNIFEVTDNILSWF